MNCAFCLRQIGPLEEHVVIKQAVKPANAPFRWRELSQACNECGEDQKTTFEYDDDLPHALRPFDLRR